jgi:hypothetical protein
MKHEYSPQEALDLLLRKLNERDQELAVRVRAAVNAGTDVQEIEKPRGPETNKPRSYRRTVPYSPEQALQVALDALQAHFVEQPLFINSLLDNMVHASLGDVIRTEGTEKAVEIELYTETQLVGELGLTGREPEVKWMRRVLAEEITHQKANLSRLLEFVDFRKAG